MYVSNMTADKEKDSGLTPSRGGRERQGTSQQQKQMDVGNTAGKRVL